MPKRIPNQIKERVKKMKKDLHPKYFQAAVKCACGNAFTAGSTQESIRVEVCSKCHPYYTGSQKLLVEAGGRVERFNKKYKRD
jgi:large subunit ribosomal protein L31